MSLLRIKRMFAEVWAVKHDEESGGVYLIDQGGMIADRSRIESIYREAIKTVDYYGDDQVKAHNNHILNMATDPDYAAIHKAERHKAPKVDRPTSGYIYLLEADNGLVKIGMTTRTPDERIAEISPKMPFKAKLIGSVYSEDAAYLEETLHGIFEDVRVNGEWFRLNPLDIPYILEFEKV